MRHSCIILMLIFWELSWSSTPQDRLYSSFVDDNISSWKTVIDSLQKDKSDNDNLITIIDAQYGYIAWAISEGIKRDAEHYISLMENNLKKLEQTGGKSAELYAYRGALMSYKLGLSKWKAPVLGPKILEEINKALEISPNNTLALNLKANSLYYRPSVFGGDKNEALKIYLKCEKIMQEYRMDWKYITLLITMAQLYESLDNKTKAIEYCNKILKIEPNFKWVKNVYLPKLTSK
ncbi:MAG: tetratricopeptide repeat protein [Bacteroidales bacterium]